MARRRNDNRKEAAGLSGTAQGARRATEAAPDSARRGKGRWSARRKATVVLELMRGAELEATPHDDALALR